ncbi:T9SS type A sorting domain-containing protein [Ekhidna sp. MALMAid0563]|uniref:T9SS type A sorting domain-containing protein n=1 Tax=Ekhidna sp. MALMAid0563 TaxID=3143937 RepID=UPI0032DE81E8
MINYKMYIFTIHLPPVDMIRTVLSITLIGIYVFAMAQCPSYTTTNTQSGTCNEPAGNITYSGPGNITLTVNGDLTINGNFTVQGENLVVNGTLNVTGAFTSGAGSSVTIGNGGTINSNSLASGLAAIFTVANGGTLNVVNDAGSGLFAAFIVENGGVVDVGGDFTTGGLANMVLDGAMDVGGTFTNAGGGFMSGSGDLTAGNYVNNGDDSGFNGNYNGAPLPVVLVSFTGEIDGGKVVLKWLTSQEINNEGFEIQRSKDGVNFNKIGFVAGHGNSNEEHYYEYTDWQPLLDRSYYRFKQVDYDGQFEFSPIVMVDGEGLTSSLEVFPNPTLGTIQIRGSIDNVQLFDPIGRSVLYLDHTTSSEAEQMISRALEASPSGTYTISTQTAGSFERIRVVKK